jgi:site-specific DNA-cytosine methylase
MGRQDYETETLIAHALRGEGFDASEDGTGRGTPLVPVAHAFDPRYKALGNSMAVPCMAWIGQRIAMVDAL